MHRITPSAAAIPAQVSDVCSLNWLLQPVTSNCQHSSSTSHAHRASWGTHEHRDLARHVRSRSLWPLQSAELAILLMCVAWPSDSPSSFFGRCFHSIAECGFICLPVERILAAQSLQPMHSPWPAGPEQLQRMRPATHLLCPKDSGTAATLTLGLAPLTGHFQRFMSNAFSDLPFAFPYLDNMVFGSKLMGRACTACIDHRAKTEQHESENQAQHDHVGTCKHASARACGRVRWSVH